MLIFLLLYHIPALAAVAAVGSTASGRAVAGKSEGRAQARSREEGTAEGQSVNSREPEESGPSMPCVCFPLTSCVNTTSTDV